jgi:hypothetical protein
LVGAAAADAVRAVADPDPDDAPESPEYRVVEDGNSPPETGVLPPGELVGGLAPAGGSVAPVVPVPGALGADPLTLGVDALTLGVDALTLGVDTLTPGTETSTLGTETSTLGTDTPTLGTEIPTLGTDIAGAGNDIPALGTDPPTDACAHTPVTSPAPAMVSDAPNAIHARPRTSASHGQRRQCLLARAVQRDQAVDACDFEYLQHRLVVLRADHRQRPATKLVQPHDGAHQHADGGRVDERHRREVQDQAPGAGVDVIGHAPFELRARRVVDLPTGDQHDDVLAVLGGRAGCIVTSSPM